MIIVRLQGGLGNQLFQYAMGRVLAERHKAELKLDLSWYATTAVAAGLERFARPLELGNFRVRLVAATTEEVRRVKGPWRRDRMVDVKLLELLSVFGVKDRSYVRETVELFDPRWKEIPDNVYLDGYWQSPHYFFEIEGLIREEFQFADNEIPEFAEECLEPHRESGRPLVAVHVRRGDLAYAVEILGKPRLIYGPPARAEYFAAAMRLFAENSLFLVFSDGDRDLDWCRENLAGPNLLFVRGNTALQDFAIMQRCDHNVISNSTFSWWAAWLNCSPGKRVVAPRKWFYDNGAVRAPLECLIPREWTLL